MSEKLVDIAIFLISILSRAVIVLTLIYLVLPVFIIVPVSFTSGDLMILPTPGWSIRWYETLISNPLWSSAFINSLIVGLSSTVLATIIGTLSALGLSRMKSRIKALIMALVISPMIIPVVITAVAMFISFSALGLTGSYLGLVLGHTVIAVPFVVVTVAATLQVFDWRLTQAAASLGASPSRAFRHVIMPLIMPGIASGAIFAFATSFDDIILALFIGNPAQRTLPREIFSGIRENTTPAIAAAAIVMIALSVLLMISMEALRARSVRLTVTQK